MREWQLLPTPDSVKVKQLMQEFDIDQLTATLIAQRGIEDVAGFLRPDLSQLHDPFLLHDMDGAIERIQDAAFSGEQILIYGDYDLDGVSATTVLYQTLLMLGADVQTYLPNRFTDGYGPNQAVYERFIQSGVSLIITVDNGISGKPVIDWAQKQGVDVIVTDHHALPDELPNATAVVHPRHPDGQYPFGELSGVGVAFKVAQALLADSPDELPTDLMDLVALGQIADVVPLVDENRVLVSFGLQQLNAAMRPGLKHLLKKAGHAAKEPVTAETVSFKIAPRLNAVGRVADAQVALDLLVAQSDEQALQLAQQVEAFNLERQQLVTAIMTEATQQAQAQSDKKVLVLVGQNWHEGVLGIVASRLVEATGKPTILLTQSQDEPTHYKGSGRSVGALDLHALLAPFSAYFVNFGGHASAVGLSIASEQLPAFVDDLHKTHATLDVPEKPVKIALTLPAEHVGMQTFEALTPLAPFGAGNEQPIFLFDQPMITGGTLMGSDKQHVKFTLANQQTTVEALAFNRPEWASYLTKTQGLQFAATLSKSFFAGRQSLSLMLLDIQASPSAETQTAAPSPSPSAETQTAAPSPSTSAAVQQQFRHVYKFIAQHPHVNFQAQLQQIANHLKVSTAGLKVMLQVFLELNFVTIEAGFVRVNPDRDNKPLHESPTYRRYIENRG
jgi:single-stranded-DNA-specific exonuclease